MCIRKIAAVGLLYVFASVACLAAGTPNFSGHWVLDVAASTFRFKPVSSQIMDIKQTDSQLEVMATTGNAREKHIYALDGAKRKENVEGVMEVEICARWQGATLELSTEAGRSKTVQVWQLLDGGKTLAIDSTSSGLISRNESYRYRRQ